MLRSGFAELEMDSTALGVRVSRDRFERIDRHRAETVRRDADPDVVTGEIFFDVGKQEIRRTGKGLDRGTQDPRRG